MNRIRDGHQLVELTRLDKVNPCNYPNHLEPYPKAGSYSERLDLMVFDLITPDGYRVWQIAGWDENGKIRAWTLQDAAKNLMPIKVRTDHPHYFAVLKNINQDSSVKEQFVSDYLAAHHKMGEQVWKVGCDWSMSAFDFVGTKVHPYGPTSTEHVVKDADPFMRLLYLDPVRAGDPQDLVAVDMWEVTSSWHTKTSGLGHPKQQSTETGHYLYRLYNKAGHLLYVGVTDNVFRRWKEHSRTKPWWSQVHKFTQDWYPNRASVEAAERRAIQTENPVYNVTHSKNFSGNES